MRQRAAHAWARVPAPRNAGAAFIPMTGPHGHGDSLFLPFILMPSYGEWIHAVQTLLRVQWKCKRMDSQKPVKYLLALVAVLAAALCWVISDAFTERVVKKGQTAPNFEIKTDSGRTITPRNFGGKLLVLNFWATWCPPCVAETPSLNAMSKQLKDQGIVVVGVSVDKNENSYRAFTKRMGIAFETMRDPEARLSASFGTFKFPETYLITPDGRVVDKIISNVDWMSPESLDALRAYL